MRRDELLEGDLLSKVLLVGSGTVIVLALLTVVVAMFVSGAAPQ